jgi:translation initiation factor 6 (eIF-6)
MKELEQKILDRAIEIKTTANRYAIANRIDVVDHLALLAAKLEYQLNAAIKEKLEAEQD